MVDCKNGVGFEHSWPGESHDLLDFVTHVLFVAVNFAFRARAFVRAEWTFIKPNVGIFAEL